MSSNLFTFIPPVYANRVVHSKQKILFFDGICNLCNGFVDALIRRDKERTLFFASLQGETAKKLLDPKWISKPKSLVFYIDGKVWIRTRAVCKVASSLGGGWRLFWIFSTPLGYLFDPIYELIARFRYVVFGKQTCRLPTPEEKKYFLS